MVTIDSAVSVLAARNLNLSIFQQIWLIEQGIIKQEEFSGKVLFSPVAVNIPAPLFDFLVIPERVQVTLNSGFDEASNIFKRTVGTIAGVLPHTPFSALGINLNIFVEPTNKENFPIFCRKLLLGDANPLRDEFASEDARFGMYLSKDIFDSRLKLNIKPIKKDTGEALLFNFNFHREISSPDEVNDSLQNWSNLYAYTQNIVSLFDTEMEKG